jgi:hypothetical protein
MPEVVLKPQSLPMEGERYLAPYLGLFCLQWHSCSSHWGQTATAAKQQYHSMHVGRISIRWERDREGAGAYVYQHCHLSWRGLSAGIVRWRLQAQRGSMVELHLSSCHLSLAVALACLPLNMVMQFISPLESQCNHHGQQQMQWEGDAGVKYFSASPSVWGHLEPSVAP